MGRGWQEGERDTWQKRGAQALGMEGCVSAEGDPRRRNTYNRPRGHPYKNKSHLLGGRGSPAALFTQLWAGGLQDMHPTASTMHPWAPHGLRDKYGGPRAPRSHCGARGLQPAPRSPPVPQGPCLLPGSQHPSSVGPGEHPRIQEPLSFSRGTAPLLWPAPRLWDYGPRFGAWPHSSGQPHGVPLGTRALVLRPRFVPLLRGRVAPSLRLGRPTSIAGRRCARPGIGTGERVSVGGQAGVWGRQAAGHGLGQ